MFVTISEKSSVRYLGKVVFVNIQSQLCLQAKRCIPQQCMLIHTPEKSLER